MSNSPIERKLFFAAAPEGTGDGIPMVIIGVPKAAWEYMRNGKTHTIDLTKAGIPVKLMMYGGKNHDTVKKVMDEAAAQSNIVIDDRRREDFSIKPKDGA